MMKHLVFLQRMAASVAVVSPLVLAASGCSLLRFGAYDSFDEWYVGREETFEADDIGFGTLHGSFTGYVVNDVVLRTPVYVAYELARTGLIPIALPYYAYGSLLSEGDRDASPE